MGLIQDITAAIEQAGGELYLVGGAVRDRLIGRPATDSDFLVTGVPGADLDELLSRYGRVQLVGQSFGVLKLRTQKGIVFDFNLPRTEHSTGPGHRDFNVASDHKLPVGEDLARRDFTMNAIALRAPNGTPVDPFGGKADILARRVVPTYANAYVDDPLRMLRAVRFAARFKFQLVHMDLVHASAGLISTVSPERTYMELVKIMEQAEYPSIAFRLMRTSGLLKHVLPELDALAGIDQGQKFHNMDALEHSLVAVDAVPSAKLHVRFAALLHDIGKATTRAIRGGQVTFHQHQQASDRLASELLHRLRAPSDLIVNVLRLVRNHMFELQFDELTPHAVRRLLARIGPELVDDLVDLRMGDRIASGKPSLGMGRIGKLKELIAAELAEPAFSLKNLKVNGHDLIDEIRVEPGPEIGRILNALLAHVMEEPALNTREQLLDLARSMVQKEGDDGAHDGL